MSERLEFGRTRFDPAVGGTEDPDGGTVTYASESDGDPSVYVYDDAIILAVNVALTVARPLLVRGEPGVGKSTLARNLAAVLGWRFYREVITSRTHARDLLWEFDAVRRLGDAQAGPDQLRPRSHYIEPGVLWWAFDPDSAARRGVPEADRGKDSRFEKAIDPSPRESPHAVVLLDEIDKADPDVPNDLLEPLEGRHFQVTESGTEVRQVGREVLVVLTTNGERELPPAFLRRCVNLDLGEPGAGWLVRVGSRWFPEQKTPFLRELADRVMELRAVAEDRGARPPSTAEYLDAVRVCTELDVGLDSDTWLHAEHVVLAKAPELRELERPRRADHAPAPAGVG